MYNSMTICVDAIVVVRLRYTAVWSRMNIVGCNPNQVPDRAFSQSRM